MQTVPPWVYLIPAVTVFSLGRVPALIATVICGVPPMLRLTTLALRQIPKPFLEMGHAVGATRGTILWKIELPSAKPTLLVGLNQCILLSLAMAVLAGLVGAGAGVRGHPRPVADGTRARVAGRAVHRGRHIVLGPGITGGDRPFAAPGPLKIIQPIATKNPPPCS